MSEEEVARCTLHVENAATSQPATPQPATPQPATPQPATRNLPATPAIFLDRDGTVIEQVHHLSKVEEVTVFPFAREALQLLTEQGFRCVIVTNQSAIGRGLLNEKGLSAIHEEMLRQLGQDDLIHGIYFCPLMPTSGDPTIVESIDRKPGPGMLQRAAVELDLDLERSWMIGDAISDMLAGRNARCRGTVLVRTGYGRKTELEHAGEKLQVARCRLQVGEEKELQVAGCRLQVGETIDYITDNLLTAARLIARHDHQ